MAGLPYEVVHALPPQAPKGQLPFIEDNGKRIADSQFIIEYLRQTYGDRVDAHLSPEERAVSNALQRLTENHLCWAFVFARFGKRDANWAENKRGPPGRGRVPYVNAAPRASEPSAPRLERTGRRTACLVCAARSAGRASAGRRCCKKCSRREAV